MFNPISCGICIAKITTRLNGYDPRQMIRQCAWSTLNNGKGGNAFKKCLVKKIEQTRHDITNADNVAEEIWQQLKKKCSG